MIKLQYNGQTLVDAEAEELYNNINIRTKFPKSTCCDNSIEVGRVDATPENEFDLTFYGDTFKECPTCKRIEVIAEYYS
jgi:hypothetical protein